MNMKVKAPENDLISENNADATEDRVCDTKIMLASILNIQGAAKLHEQLMTALESQNRIEIDASDVNTIDTSTLQLLVVLKQESVKLHKQVIIASSSERFKEAAKLLGIAELLDVA